ncbi:hypothetical protein M7I_2032 [Glarea lozoyensis 74030]|uniref:Uncharacterized protein n=1 Tax=Glarea lozoyensis (strain ATCC 74030 / MF5533) TaxID=1104152 RepID=H0EHP8_GLAL7|nr:hypothetical protein M7I_2032 [Glarea lozoyensis 74030]
MLFRYVVLLATASVVLAHPISNAETRTADVNLALEQRSADKGNAQSPC